MRLVPPIGGDRVQATLCTRLRVANHQLDEFIERSVGNFEVVEVLLDERVVCSASLQLALAGIPQD